MQLHALLRRRRPRRRARGADLRRALLPRGDYARQRAGDLPCQRDPGARDDVQPDRRLCRPRGVRHRHLRGGRARTLRRRAHDRRRPPRAGGRAPAGAVPRARRCRRGLACSAMRDAVRVAMWSGPRNISTAMMRAWENRPDTVVVDEPLCAAYLARTGIAHPARDEVIASQPTDLAAAVADLSAPLAPGRSVHYAKHMAHHVPRDADLRWTLRIRNVLLIRDPAEVVASYVRSRETCEPDDIGLPQQGWLRELWEENETEVPILDASDFLRAPEAHLRWLCDWLGISFTDQMLSWPPGPRESDGVWAEHWYATVWS